MVCGRPLDGTEPWWMTEPSRGEHESCRDGSKHSFPYARHLWALRKTARRLAVLYREVVRVGTLLARWERQWPKDGAHVFRRGHAELERLRQRFAEATDERKWPPKP